ncbi:MAG: hypothetical protein WDO19_20145 [Bacteroidota bacterium]
MKLADIKRPEIIAINEESVRACDVPIETVSKMLGHKSIRATQIYAKASRKKSVQI